MHHVHEDITLGHRLRRRRIGDMHVHEVCYPGAWKAPNHAHAHANLTFVLEGCIEEATGGEAQLLRACDAVVKPAGTVHSNRCGPGGARTIVIELPGSDAASPRPAIGSEASYAILRGPEVVRAALAAIESSREATVTTAEAIQELVVEMFALAWDTCEREPVDASVLRNSRGEPWLAEVRDLLHDGFAVPLRVHDLAAMVKRHPVYLARAFRRRYGCAIASYRRRLQVCEAARRLADGDEPLASVALSSGFADQSHLCRRFRAALGVSPGRFRRSLRVHRA
jgi:AraC-like DNA-binding protein